MLDEADVPVVEIIEVAERESVEAQMAREAGATSRNIERQQPRKTARTPSPAALAAKMKKKKSFLQILLLLPAAKLPSPSVDSSYCVP